jgi:hypothetical protein
MPKKNSAPPEISKDESLNRRAAMKRIAAGLAGAGIAAVIGIMCQVQPPTSSNIMCQVQPPTSSNIPTWDDNYGNSKN